MKKLFPVFTAIALIITAGLMLPSFISKSGSEKTIIISQDRNLESFDELTVGGSMDVFITQGDQKVVIKGDEKLVERIKTVVKNGRLEISFDTDGFQYNAGSSKVEIYISVPVLSALALSGSGNITGQNEFTSDKEFSVSLSGSGDIEFGINASAVQASIAGSGNMILNGKAKDAHIDIAGSGDFVGDKFKTGNAAVSIAGSGDAIVHADDKLNASIAGSGDIIYSGNATVQSSTTGSGDVRKKSI